MMNFVAQIIGGFAVSFWVMSLQNKDRHNVLFYQMIANLLYMIQYLFLGVLEAMSMNFVSLLRCFIFSRCSEDSTKKWTIFFLSLIILLAVVTYNGVFSLIPIVISIFYTISSSKSNVKWNRVTVLICAFVWIYYNYKVGAYISIVGNIFEIISGVVSLLRFRNKT